MVGELRWWDYVYCQLRCWYMICRFGLDGSEKLLDDEIEKLKNQIKEKENHQDIVDNWR